MAQGKKSLEEHIKDIDRLSRSLKAIAKMRSASDNDQIGLIDKALKAVKAMDLEDLMASLEQKHTVLAERIRIALDNRRENLLRAAKAAGVPHKRYGDYDRIGFFKVTYKGTKVRLEVGSEALSDLEEIDGSQLYKLIEKEARTLEGTNFSREQFFQMLKAAIRFAREQGKTQDGKVPVRALFPYVVATIQTQSEGFLKKPETKSFRNYSTAQFVYDLARFGRDGWTVGGERLSTQTPNMATIQQGKAMTLPSLNENESTGPQLAVLWIEKRET